MEFLFKEWQELGTPELIERKGNLNFSLHKIKKIITLTGVRRSGKTYFMFQIINKLSEQIPKERIFYLNFEDERIERRKESLTSVIPTLMKLYGTSEKYYLFLDELQVIPEWSRWLRRAYDNYKNITFFVSGSSSKLSSMEIPSELRGRALNFEIFPLSFREFLQFKNIELEKHYEYSERKLSKVKKALTEYLEYGGFPEVVLEKSILQKKRIVQEYFKTIVGIDIAERHNVRKTYLLHDFLKLLLNTKEFSINKSVNILKSQGKQAGKGTLINYTKYAQEGYFCFFIPRFSYKVKEQIRCPQKVYFIDNSFITNISFRFSKEYGRLYENIVALQLNRLKTEDSAMELFYWKDNENEVDFVIKKGLKINQLMQVCYDVTNFDTKQKEVRALLKASKELKCKNLFIITKDYEAEEEAERFGVKRKINFIPLWKWLLE